MTISIPGIDSEKGLDLYDDDEEIYLAVIRSYVSNTPNVLDKIRSVSAETLPDYVASIHGIKGTSANIGAEEVRKEALELEQLAKAGDLDSVLARNDTFLKKADALINNIRNWLNQNG